MNLQSDISYKLNQKKIGSTLKFLFDRKEDDYFIGRTEFDSPDEVNKFLVKADKYLLIIGDFAYVKILKTDYYDLNGNIVAN